MKHCYILFGLAYLVMHFVKVDQMVGLMNYLVLHHIVNLKIRAPIAYALSGLASKGALF